MSGLRFSLAADSGLAVWQPIAKDGADLPPQLARPGAAVLTLAVGETADAAFLPTVPGTYRLTANPPDRPAVWSQVATVR